MFWLGVTVAFVGGVTGIGIVRQALQNRMPRLREVHLDWILVVALVGGLLLAVWDRMASDLQQDLVRYAMLSPTGRVLSSDGGSMSLDGGQLELDLQQLVQPQASGPVTIRCAESETRVAQLLGEHPNLPHLAWVLAVCRRAAGDPSWRDEAHRCAALTKQILDLKPHAAWYSELAAACNELSSAER